MGTRTGLKATFLTGIALLALAMAATAVAGGRPLVTDMSGAEEVPAGVGDPDGTGTASLTLNAGDEDACYELTWENIDGTMQRAHIHEAAAGVNGPIIVSLFENESFPGTGAASGCDLGDATREEIRRILNDPEDFYVNVHDTVRPGGAIRGQLER
ncbi:MAG: CHRD domain-containing protein [Actinomycetota bacterium]